MGSRILTFLKVGLKSNPIPIVCSYCFLFLFFMSFPVLQKLRIQFVAKRNQKKRQLEESSEKEKVKPSAKRVKSDKSKVEIKSVKTEMVEEAQAEDEKTKAKVENMDTENAENTKPEGDDQDEDSDEDPEEDPEEDEDMVDASPDDNTGNKVSEFIGCERFILFYFIWWSNTSICISLACSTSSSH